MDSVVFKEILPAVVQGLGASVGILAAALVACIALSVVEARGLDRPWVQRVLLLGGIGVGLYFGWQRLWLCDDAFISFHYAANFAAGNGLVFNPGEWVEGYTNFLWTALLGGLGALGVDIPMAGLFGNLLSFVAVIWLVNLVVRRHSPPRADGTRFAGIPWAAIALCGSLGFTTFASSGLETMPAAALIVAAVLVTDRRAFLGGLLFVLAAMTRPDHLLFWGCMGLAMAGEDVIGGEGPLFKRLRWRRYLAFTAPLILVFLPYFLWRWQAYGDLFPNTYYAKSGGSAYYEQGWKYLSVWAGRSGAWLFIPLMFISALGRVRSRAELRLRLFGCLAVLIFGHYVVRVGGDFMADRFFVVLWPIIFITLETRARVLQASGHVFGGGLLVATAVAMSVTPISLFDKKEKRWQIAAEHTFYPVASLFPLVVGSRYFNMGKSLGEVFEDADYRPPIAIGCVGMVGYYSGLPLVDRYGLTNRAIAKKVIKRRGRPGHEKRGSRDEVMREGAVLALSPLWGRQWKPTTQININGVRLNLLHETPELRALIASEPRVRTPGLDRRLQALARGATRQDLEEVVFLKVLAPTRTDAHRAIVERLGSLEEFETPNLPPNTTFTGGKPRVIRRANPPAGVDGRGWLELARGKSEVRIPLDLTGHAELRFSLGGHSSHRAELWQGGRRLQFASPRGAQLAPVIWRVEALGEVELRLIALPAQAPLRVDGLRVPRRQGDVRSRLRSPPPDARALSQLLAEAEAELPASDPQLLGVIARRVARRWTFDAPRWGAGVKVTGAAFGRGPVGRELKRQARVRGKQGPRFVNSYHHHDKGVGRIELPMFTLPAGEIIARVAGGRDCARTYVGLEVDGQIVRRVCGRRDETLRPAQIDASIWAGKQGRIVIEDAGTAQWDHILVDDILVHVEAPPAAVQLPVKGTPPQPGTLKRGLFKLGPLKPRALKPGPLRP
ncbi:MAG: hypothetical protein ACI9U2_001988 [Bradymonadia bacterium]|jgi:hypothetical protein